MKNIYRILFNKNLFYEYYYDYENKIIYKYYIKKVFKEIYLKKTFRIKPKMLCS